MRTEPVTTARSRRQFIFETAGGALTLSALPFALSAGEPRTAGSALRVEDLPRGNSPAGLPLAHFPSRLHALVWRNWQLVPLERLARLVGTRASELRRMGHTMGLDGPPRITRDLERRSTLTVIRRNWHLLPYAQLLDLLGWTPDQLAFTLREDDFLFIKLGSLKPQCEPIRYTPPTAETVAAEARLARLVRAAFPETVSVPADPLFGFVSRLSKSPPAPRATQPVAATGLSPRFCYSYFALYGDPLLEPAADPYPDGFLARLAAAGVDGVWLQAVLYKLAPFPWQPELSARHQERLESLAKLVARARRHGIRLWLYLNEPRAMPLRFYEQHPELKGVVAGDHATLCTSAPAVRDYLRGAVASIVRAVPDLGGFFTISASENLTNCWSHGGGKGCSRCASRGAAEVIAELHTTIFDGIRDAGGGASPVPESLPARGGASSPGGRAGCQLIAWDWGWADDWAGEIVKKLPAGVALMSVSEWSIPIRRGGVETTVGEYSISTIGPGPRAKRHWGLARERGLRTIAKIQAGNTWELSAVPYIPAVANVAQHAANLRQAGVDGLMLGWTLGGYPSPNLEVVAALCAADAGSAITPDEAMLRVATRRFGRQLAPAFVEAWRQFSAAFREFPYHGGVVYNAPMQFGPSNLLWGEPTGYQATMVGFPYDDLTGWRQVYPVEVFIAQFEKVADGFARALTALQATVKAQAQNRTAAEEVSIREELSVAEAALLHFRTVANQARFVAVRDAARAAKAPEETRSRLAALEPVLKAEIETARRLHALQSRDSRLGFEASNQYYYVPLDLVEKVINCQDLLDRWLPEQRR